MKHVRYVIFSLVCGFYLGKADAAQTPAPIHHNHQQPAHNNNQAHAQNIEIIFNGIAEILSNFSSIIQNAHNQSTTQTNPQVAPQTAPQQNQAQVVVPGVVGMLGGLAKIVAHIMKNMPTTRDTITAEDIEHYLVSADPALHAKLAHMLNQIAVSFPR